MNVPIPCLGVSLSLLFGVTPINCSPTPLLLGVWGAHELRSRYLSIFNFLAPHDEVNAQYTLSLALLLSRTSNCVSASNAQGYAKETVVTTYD